MVMSSVEIILLYTYLCDKFEASFKKIKGLVLDFFVILPIHKIMLNTMGRGAILFINSPIF